MITTEITREQMPTATTANNHPVHRWYNFIAGYSPEYVEFTCISKKKWLPSQKDIRSVCWLQQQW